MPLVAVNCGLWVWVLAQARFLSATGALHKACERCGPWKAVSGHASGFRTPGLLDRFGSLAFSSLACWTRKILARKQLFLLQNAFWFSRFSSVSSALRSLESSGLTSPIFAWRLFFCDFLLYSSSQISDFTGAGTWSKKQPLRSSPPQWCASPLAVSPGRPRLLRRTHAQSQKPPPHHNHHPRRRDMFGTSRDVSLRSHFHHCSRPRCDIASGALWR